MRIVRSPSIGHAIFALAGILIVLMAVVAAINTVLSLRVSDLIGSLNRTYVPVYAMLAHAQIRSLEQSLALRQAALATLASPPEPVDEILAAEARSKDAADAELAAARAAIITRTQQVSEIDDRVVLGRLAVQVESVIRQRAAHSLERAEMVSALKAHDAEAIRASLAALDELRIEQSEQMEQMREESRDFAAKAVQATEANGRDVVRLTLITLAIATLLGIFLATWIVRRLVGSIRRLVEATKAAEQGDYGAELPVTSEDEIGRLTRSFNLMLSELRLKQKIRDTFGRYLDPKLVSRLIEGPDGIPPAERKVMTVLFADMAGFSHLAEEVNPPLLVIVLNRYLSLLSEAVRITHGIVDKFLGDGIMAFWGPPFTAEADQAQFACDAACRQIAQFGRFRSELPDLIGVRRYVPRIGIRIGIATGDVIAGSIGSQTALNFTVMGDAVNVASRLEGLNKVYGTSVLVTEATARSAGLTYVFREIDRVTVIGRDEPFPIHELMGPAGSDEHDAELLACYARGLEAYRKRDWDVAFASFSECQTIRPGDGPSTVMARRCEEFRSTPPAPNWNGAWSAHTK